MDNSDALRIIQEAITLLIEVSAPVLIVGLTVGLLVSIFQAMTQINEQTLSFVPKILAILAALIVFGSWMLTKLVQFTIQLFENIAVIVR